MRRTFACASCAIGICMGSFTAASPAHADASLTAGVTSGVPVGSAGDDMGVPVGGQLTIQVGLGTSWYGGIVLQQMAQTANLNLGLYNVGERTVSTSLVGGRLERRISMDERRLAHAYGALDLGVVRSAGPADSFRDTNGAKVSSTWGGFGAIEGGVRVHVTQHVGIGLAGRIQTLQTLSYLQTMSPSRSYQDMGLLLQVFATL